jgi:hypothetical protein
MVVDSETSILLEVFRLIAQVFKLTLNNIKINQMYLDKTTCILSSREGKRTPTADGRSALDTMRVIEVAHLSATSHREKIVQ